MINTTNCKLNSYKFSCFYFNEITYSTRPSHVLNKPTTKIIDV